MIRRFFAEILKHYTFDKIKEEEQQRYFLVELFAFRTWLCRKIEVLRMCVSKGDVTSVDDAAVLDQP